MPPRLARLKIVSTLWSVKNIHPQTDPRSFDTKKESAGITMNDHKILWAKVKRLALAPTIGLVEVAPKLRAILAVLVSRTESQYTMDLGCARRAPRFLEAKEIDAVAKELLTQVVELARVTLRLDTE